MQEMSNSNNFDNRKNLPGCMWWFLFFVPLFYVIPLIYVGAKYHKKLFVILGIVFFVFTIASFSSSTPGAFLLIWVAVIISYAVLYGKIKKELLKGNNSTVQANPQPQNTPVSSNYASSNSQAAYSDITIPGTTEQSQTIQYYPHEVRTFIRPSYYSADDFISDMKRFENTTPIKAVFVPFQCYWPTYHDMNKAQQNWYFFWRTQVRNGIYLRTDLSYIFVHIYELLFGFGWTNPQDGYNALIALWGNYRDAYPNLDRYLCEWLFDFSVIHELSYELPKEWGISMPYRPELKDILLEQHIADKPLKLTFSMIDSLCDYSLVGSKFYNDGHQTLMEEAIPRVVSLADAALIKRKGKGVLAVYGPSRPRSYKREAFQGALRQRSGIYIERSVKSYSTSTKLRSYINELVRYAENSLRALYGCRGRLRGVELDPETAELVDAFLKREYSPKIIQEAAKTPEVSLDFDNIDKLRVESNAVRDALEVAEANEEKPLLTDLREVGEIYVHLSERAIAFLDKLHDNKWECVISDDNQSIEEINRVSNQYIACSLIVIESGKIIVEDDYRDELEYIYDNKDEYATNTSSNNSDRSMNFDNMSLSDEMRNYLDALTDLHLGVLSAIISDANPQGKLAQIADNALTMPEILIDEINDIAMQYLDDIVIDTFGSVCIFEQYEQELKTALGQEVA